MKQNSVLRQIYTKQQQTTDEQSKKTLQKASNKRLFVRWILIGGLFCGIILAPFVVLYIRKESRYPIEGEGCDGED
jgi:magnesium-transporting ATPase (P-type)